jgi:hypothetical protein
VNRNKNDFFFFSFTKFLCFSLLVIAVTSCSKSPVRVVNPVTPLPANSTFENGIFVVNEGDYLHGNASITFITPKDTVDQNIFEAENDRSLGDVAESMYNYNSDGLILVNNSNKIEVVSLKNFKSIKSIVDGNSPRFMAIIDSTKAYVTNMYQNISVINMSTLAIEKSIPTGTWTEALIQYNNYMFVSSIGIMNETTSQRNACILVINTKSDQITDTIRSGKEPVGIVMDKKNKIWVLCTGGYDHYEPPTLMRIDPILMLVEKTFSFPDPDDTPSRLCINAHMDTLYFLDNGVYQMPVSSTAVPSSPFIPANGHNYYGLGINPSNGNIFVSDAIDYVQRGVVYQYNQVSGSLINSFTAGIIPGSFCFALGSNKK